MRTGGIVRDAIPNFESLGDALDELERNMNETVGSVNSQSDPVNIQREKARSSSRWQNQALMTCKARTMVHDRMDRYEGGHPMMQMGHIRPIYVRELRHPKFVYCVSGEGSECRATEVLRRPKVDDGENDENED